MGNSRLLQTSDGNSTTDCPGEENNSVTSSLPTWVTWILVVFLVCMSALFSGLTLGLMGLDPTGLEIVMNGDNPELSKAAEHIYPVRKNGNRLLCTLLLGNVAVNALLSILMADVAGGLAGFLVSTAVIVIFGEILPRPPAVAMPFRSVPVPSPSSRSSSASCYPSRHRWVGPWTSSWDTSSALPTVRPK